MKKFLFIFCLMFLVVVFTACLNADAITSKPTTTSPSETHPDTTDTSIFVEEITQSTETTNPSENDETTEETIPEETIPETTITETVPVIPETTKPIIIYKDVNETVYATQDVNIRKESDASSEKIGLLKKGESITRIGIGDNGWSKVRYNDITCFIHSDYISTEKPIIEENISYPLTYSDASCTITIYKEWYKNAWCYAAHIEFTDYERLSTECANGKYNNGYETTSHCANRLGAIFAVNGCYSAPYLNYTVIRDGKICNGSGRNLCLPAVYSGKNGLLLSAWETGGVQGIVNKNVDALVAEGLVTDSFCFGPPNLQNGIISGTNGGSRAQRTFIGTNENAGDIWIVVSDGRYNDGVSAGLTGYETAEYLLSKGCTFGVNLDGGGSSTMYFNGKVLNANKNNERAVVDFLYFK